MRRLILAIWPSLQNNVDTLNQLWESYPESIRKAFGGENFKFGTFDGFLSVEYFTQMWVIIMIAFSVSIATGAICRRRSRKERWSCCCHSRSPGARSW